jgi:hypothetical protein
MPFIVNIDSSMAAKQRDCALFWIDRPVRVRIALLSHVVFILKSINLATLKHYFPLEVISSPVK